MRQIILDTETTGLEPSQGHRIIEIGCVEMINRKLTGRHYHQYIQPQRKVDEGAMEVHGITDEFLRDKPVFAEIVQDFFQFIEGAQLIIHNAPFDIGFINHEFALLNKGFKTVDQYCSVIDTLAMARQKHPGQKNNLDALCKRYGVDNSQRDLHGALLDAEILADVYLFMTGGQTSLGLGAEASTGSQNTTQVTGIQRLPRNRRPLPIVQASQMEMEGHSKILQKLGAGCIWSKES